VHVGKTLLIVSFLMSMCIVHFNAVGRGLMDC
jgi:hypothetical protein